MKIWIALLISSLLVSACGTSIRSGPSADVTPELRTRTPAPTPLPANLRMIIKSSSVSLVVEDPPEALSVLEKVIQDAGGNVMSASSYFYLETGSYASLNAKVPPDKLADLRQAAHKLAIQIVSDSIYNTDVSTQYKLAHEKLVKLNLAEDRLWELIATSKDAEMIESLSLLRELLKTDIENVEGELLRYEQDSSLANLDITLTEMTAAQNSLYPTAPQLILE